MNTIHTSNTWIIKSSILLLLMIAITNQNVNAQYYYRDIISAKQAAADMANYRQHGIKTVKLHSFESDGSESDDFFCERKLSKDYRKSSLYTRTGITGISLMESYFDEKGQLVKTYDSSDLAIRNTEYFYDEAGHLIECSMHSKSNDDDFVNEVHEQHRYKYEPDGTIKLMWKIKNNTDSSVVFFSCDEHQDVSIEKNDKENIIYYYYFDDQHRLTDVVHAVPYKEKLVADYVFEYDKSGNMSSMTSTRNGQNDYTLWSYQYQNGLKTIDEASNKEGKILGKISYEYK